MPVARQSAATVNGPVPCSEKDTARVAKASRNRSAVLDIDALPLGIEGSQNRERFGQAHTGYLQRLGRQRRLVEEGLRAARLLLPIAAMLLGDREVLATGTRGGLAPLGIGGRGGSEAGAGVLAGDAKAPVTHPEREAGVNEHAGI